MKVLLVAALAMVLLLGRPPSVSSPCASCPGASFGPAPRDYAVANSASIMAEADFNGDGLGDLVVGGVNVISVLLRTPGGHFTAGARFFLSNTVSSVATADFNGDGKVDVAVNRFGGYDILLGNGDGTFAAPASYALTGTGQGLAAGDVDGDGHPDLVLSSTAAGFLLLINAGNGTFGPPTPIGPHVSSNTIFLRDFNNDGKLDVLVPSSPLGTLFLGSGGGAFPSLPLSVPLSGFVSIIATDLNRDGKLDLALTGSQSQVLMGRGDGSFDLPQSIVASIPFQQLASADVNGDGWPDLVFAGGATIAVSLSNGSGGFQPAVGYEAGFDPAYGPGALLASDLDGDGLADAAVGNPLGQSVRVFRALPGGMLETAPSLPASAANLATADFNGDGKADLVTGGFGLSIWLGDGTGNFSTSFTDAGPTQINALGTASLANNGTVDVVIAEATGFFPQAAKIHVYRGDGSGGATSLPGSRYRSRPGGRPVAG